MKLGDYIAANVERILVDWELFARGIWSPGAAVPDPLELRDHAEGILNAIVADMRTAQSAHERSEKAADRRLHGDESEKLDHASQFHGVARVGSGLSLVQVVAEYRALRASVLRLWRASVPAPNASDLDDVTRFNESVDQSLTRAVDAYTRRTDASTKMFLAILGHDLRNPLSAITLTANLAMLDATELPEHLKQITESAVAISGLITDLIDFASTAMGTGIPLTPVPADLHVLCDAIIRETRAAHPGSDIRLKCHGDLAGTWDAQRLRQVVSNLLRNACQHGLTTKPITVTVDGTAPDAVVLTVHNAGDPIPRDVLPTLFDPLVRASVQQRRSQGSVGLGLYIVREIANAHGGTADLASDAQGTTATVRLPRHTKPR